MWRCIPVHDADKRIVTAAAQSTPSLPGRPTLKPVFLSGGGGLYSTTDDYFRFAQMVLNCGATNGKRFLKTSTVELMRTNVLRLALGSGSIRRMMLSWWG